MTLISNSDCAFYKCPWCGKINKRTESKRYFFATHVGRTELAICKTSCIESMKGYARRNNFTLRAIR